MYLGFPRIRGTFLGVSGCILGSPCLGNLPLRDYADERGRLKESTGVSLRHFKPVELIQLYGLESKAFEGLGKHFCAPPWRS